MMLAWLVAVLVGQAPTDVRRLLPRQAEVQVEGTGLASLTLPPAVLQQCSRTLADLRLVTPEGVEVPYSLRAAAIPTPQGRASIEVREVARRTQERPDTPPRFVETYHLLVPSELPPGEWALSVDSDTSSFVRQVSVLDANVTTAPLATGSVFRLPGAPAKTLLPLPEVRGKLLVVTLEGEGAYLTPGFSLVRMASAAATPRAEVPLEVRETVRRGKATEYGLARPPGVVPAALRLATSTRAFVRPVEVRDGATLVGSGALARLDDGATAPRLEVSLAPAGGQTLRVLVADGDSPPLGDVAFTALVDAPVLLFAVPAGGRVALYFGGGRVFRPSYDLQDAALDARARLAEARLGVPQANTAYVPGRVLDFAMHPGAAVAMELYSHSRSLTVPETAEGVTALTLDGEDLAACQPDRRDVRVVDAQGHGWPYLLEAAAVPQWRELTLTPLPPQRGLSRWQVGLPPGGGPLDALALELGAPFVQRPYTLIRGDRNLDEQLSTGLLERHQGDTAPLAVALDLRDTARAELQVHDGDDAALAWSVVRGHFVWPRLLLVAPPGSYRLLVGNAEDKVPDYELAAARDLVLAVGAEPIAAGPLTENASRTLSARLLGRIDGQQLLLWTVLSVAVGALIRLTLRLTRK